MANQTIDMSAPCSEVGQVADHCTVDGCQHACGYYRVFKVAVFGTAAKTSEIQAAGLEGQEALDALDQFQKIMAASAAKDILAGEFP